MKQSQPPAMPAGGTSAKRILKPEVWQCMSGVLERGIRWVDRPEDIYSSLQPVLYKAVFHGGVKTMWSSVMEIPQIRRMGGCITDHDSCVEHSILLNELSSNFVS